MGLLMAGCSPFIFTLLGLGVVTGGLVVAISVAVLAMAFAASILVEHWHASPPASRWVAGARTLAVASGLIAAGVGLLGGGGLGHLVLEATRVMEYGPLWQGLVVILAFALMLDLALGLGQMFTLHRSGASAGSAMGKGTPA
jgi:hypothetical protein